MKLTINGKVIENVSKIEVEGGYEIAPEEGVEIKIHVYNRSGLYQKTVCVRDFENLTMEAGDDE